MAVLNFLNRVFVEGFWKTFCVKWIWQTFCVAWVHDAFYIQFLCRKLKYDKWKGWVYLAPCIVLLLIFTVWPIINTVRVSFLEGYDSLAVIGGATFDVGVGNFERVVNAPKFLTCLKNTMLLCVLTVPLSTILALLIAVCLNAIKPLQRALQTIFFLPYVTNSIAIGMVFMAMFQMVGTNFGSENEYIATAGIINNIIGLFGAEPINWVNANSSYAANIAVLTIYIVWNALPFKILILLGGLQSVNKQYYEAAKIDSTPRWRVFTRITVPLLSPMLAYVVITGFIGGFKEYSSIVGIFDAKMGAPGQAGTLNTMVGYIYDAIANTKHGIASAAALILFGIIFIVTMINLYVSKKKTHY
ncbi:MAG: sugar ABC transporter permease [Clostridia bacterium]|nr:sugar ABC transporter permease [Clostridia bacterium]